MDTVDGQLSWVPYSSSLLPPPPPPSLSDDSTSFFSPVVITIIAIVSSILLLVSYYVFISKCCNSISSRRRTFHAASDATESNTILKYKREEGAVDGTDHCPVCLGEFNEEDFLRILSKCGHTFHMPCIDTWLKSHANCPLCRSNVELGQDEIIVIVENAERGREEVEETEEGDDETVRRCMSVGSSEACRGLVSIGDVLRMSMEEEFISAKEDSGLVRGDGRWRWSEGGEQSNGDGRNRGLHCVRSTVRMKRSVSGGRAFLGRRSRG